MMTESPTFIARFADGIQTRMTVWHDVGRVNFFDLARGVKLARHAYRQRTGEEPVPIIAAHFESREGKTLRKYNTAQLAEAAS